MTLTGGHVANPTLVSESIDPSVARTQGYRIEIAPGHDDALILAVAVCIEQMGND